MKKGIAIIFVCVSILLLVSMPVVSANFVGDFFNGIKSFFGSDTGVTGNTIQNPQYDENVIQDPSFEANVLQAPYKYIRGNFNNNLDIGAGRLEFNSLEYYSNAQSLKYTSYSTFSYTMPYLDSEDSGLATASSGEIWNSSIWVKSETGQTNNVRIYIFALDSQYSIVSFTSTITSIENSWEKISVEYTLPEGTSYVSTRVDNLEESGEIIYLDDWNLHKINSGICGNNQIEGNEICDGSSLNGQTCMGQGYFSGILACNSNCLAYNTTFCSGGNLCNDQNAGNFGVVGECDYSGIINIHCIDANDNSYDCYLPNQEFFTYFEDYDIVVDDLLISSDIVVWGQEGRGDVIPILTSIISNENYPPHVIRCIDPIDNSYDCYLSNQEFFTYFEDYDIVVDDLLMISDIVVWGQEGRGDVIPILTSIISNENYPPHISMGCMDPNALNYGPEINIEDGSCEYSENCNDQIDNNENGVINEGCLYYSINELVLFETEVWEDSDVSVSCSFNITNQNGTLINPSSIGENCVRATIGDQICEIVYDGAGYNGLHYRSFNCDAESIGENKELICSVNNNGGPSCSLGVNSFSQPGLINVTTPLVCPSGSSGGALNIEPSITLEGRDLDANENLVFDLKLTNLIPSNSLNVVAEAGLYEINGKEELDTDIQGVLLDSNSNEIGLSLKVPSIISEGKHRIYIKTRNINETQFCMLNKYNVNLEESGFDIGGVNLDLSYISSNSIEISNGETITFTLNGVNEHSIEVKSISGTTVTFEIQSNPIMVILSEGEIAEVDLEGDGIFDIRIRLTQVTGNSIVLNLESLESFGPCVQGQIQYCGNNNEGTQSCNNNNVWGECISNSVGNSSEAGNDSILYNDEGGVRKGLPWIVILIMIMVIVLAIFFIIILLKRKFDKKNSNSGSNFLQKR